VNRPAVIATNKLLPFDALDPSEFERLCLWLVEREGFSRPQHLGDAGGEQGRDLIAYRPAASGEELWYFQCKRRKRVTAPALKAEVDKYGRLAASDPSKRPSGVVFVISAVVSSRVRDEVSAYCASHGYSCDFWARTELDMLVKRHPDVVAEFFQAAAAPQPPAVRQLPTPPGDFAGRSPELEELDAAVRGGAGILLLCGMGGVGKTTLALKLAERLAPLYPDGQLYLDLKGAGREPLSPADVMSHVVRSYRPAAGPLAGGGGGGGALQVGASRAEGAPATR
jgi:hypothetical protein